MKIHDRQGNVKYDYPECKTLVEAINKVIEEQGFKVDLSNVDLSNVDLSNVDLWNVDLSNADFWKEGIKTTKLIQISGLHYFISVADMHIKIGCELHSKEEWKSFDDKRILEMEGSTALKFWNENKEWILNIESSKGVSRDKSFT